MKIITHMQLWLRALRGQPEHKIRYGGRGRPRQYEAVGGPYDGKVLTLIDGDTAVFSVRRDKYGAKVRGRYRCGICATKGMHDTNRGTTIWKPQ